MKKVLSFALCLCMVLGMSVFAVSAADVSEIKDGAVIEFETFGGEENKDLYVFENLNAGKRPYGVVITSDHVAENGNSLSGGGVLGITERTGATSMTLTVPVSVTEPGWYDIVWYGTDGGVEAAYLSNYTVSLGDASFRVASNTTDYFKPAKDIVKGDGSDVYYYPIKCYKGRIYVAEDVEELVITAGANTNGTSSGLGVKLMLDAMVFSKYEIPTASREQEAVLEMEDYISDIRYTFAEGKSNSAGYLVEPLASGGALMNMEERTGIQAIEFNIPVKIAEDGWYAINLVASTSNHGDTSVLYIKNGEDEWVNNWTNSGYAGKEKLYYGTADAHRHYGVYDHKTAKYLTAGEYNLTASAVGITNDPDSTKFLADCLKIYSEKTDIPAGGKRLELENYRSYMSPRQSGVKTNEKGETFLNDLGGRTTGFTAALDFEESGYYDISFHGSPYNNNARSKVNFYLNGDLLMDNNNANYGVNEGYEFSQYLSAWLFTKKCVYIEAGTHELRLEALERDPNNPSNLCAWAGDYLEFTKTQLPEVSASEGVSLEMEDYLPYIQYSYGEGNSYDASVHQTDVASGGAVLDMIERIGITGVTFDIPFVVATSGWYNVNLIASHGDVGNTSVLYIKNGEDEWVNNWKNSGYAGKEKLYFGTENDSHYRYYPVYNHQLTKYIEAGEYTLTASASAITNNPNATKFLADCLKIEPFSALSEDNRIELENMKDFFNWRPSSDAADENESVTMLHAYSGQDLTGEIPVIIPESGFYKVSFFGTPYNNNGLSKIEISLDGNLLLDNNEKLSGEALGYLYKQHLPAYKFENDFMYIEKGAHTLSVDAYVRKPDDPKNECAFGMDAIAFEMIDNKAIVNTSYKTIDVTAYYDAPVSGEMIVAAYAGGKMVGCTSFNEIDCIFFDKTISYEGDVAPDTVKVMVWEDYDSAKPVAEVKIITVK